MESEILNIEPYSLTRSAKENLLNPVFHDLTIHHYNNCQMFRKMMDAVNFCPDNKVHYSEIPFLPVRLFKMYDLKSINQDNIFKTMTSSGTTGQAVSKIYLDRETSSSQTKALTKIVSSFIGTKRVPMIIIDSENVVKDRNLFSARGAGILGFSMFGSKRFYALNQNMELDMDGLNAFLGEHYDERLFR